MKKLFTSLFALVAFVNFANATVYLVQSGSAGDKTWTSGAGTVVNLTSEGKSLTEWLNATTFANDDEVWIAGGTYTVTIAWTIPSSCPAKLYGGFAGTETAVDARVMGEKEWNYINETIINGSGSSSGILGAGADRTIAIDGITFTGCTASATQVVQQRPNMTIQNCKFTSNACTAVLYYITSASRTATLKNSYFYGNTNEKTNGNGGCVNINNGSSGGVYTLTNCTFEGNSNANTGSAASAGIKIQGAGTTNVMNSIFHENSASAGYSSAISSTVATAFVSNCVFYKNSGKPAAYSTMGNYTNCTFANNANGAITIIGTTPTTNVLTNSVFWGTTEGSSQIYVSGSSNIAATISYCAYLKLSTDQTNASNNQTLTTSDPGFTDYTNGDFSLTTAATQLIGKANSSAAPATDILGNTWDTADIGAYAYKVGSGVSSSTNDNKQVVKKEYFNLTGVALGGSIIDCPKGLYIEKNTYDDGSASSRKILKK